MLKKRVVIILTILSCSFSGLAYAQCPPDSILNLKKTAIVFGEKDYKHKGSLLNPINDAQDIRDSLTKIGFKVQLYENTPLETMKMAIDDWCNELQRYDVALFYYSGHGAELHKENFLFPTDIDLKGPSDLFSRAYPAQQVIDRLATSGVKYSIVILDACRSNPFTEGWNRGDEKQGLSPMSGKGSFIAFAAAANATASDGDKRNGVFTEGILKYITKPNLTISELFTKVNYYVQTHTSPVQIPYQSTSLTSDFCFTVNKIRKSASPAESTHFMQPSSAISMAPTGDFLYIADSSDRSILVKDAQTLSTISELLKDTIKPTQITSGFGKNIYIIDSTNHSLTIFNWPKRIIKTIKLSDAPISITLNKNEQRAYVASISPTGGAIDVVELVTDKVTKHRTTTSKPSCIILSPDGKYFYVSFETTKNDSSLLVFDSKSANLVKSLSDQGPIAAIIITPDNKKLYAANNSVASGEIKVIDLTTFGVLKKIDVKARSFGISPDGKYLFAENNSKIISIKVDSDEVINELPIHTTPKGIAFSNDNKAFVWLPQEENPIFYFDVSEQMSKKQEVDPEVKLQRFKDEQKNNPLVKKSTERQEQQTLYQKDYDTIINVLIPTIRILSNDLNKEIGNIYDFDSNITSKDFDWDGFTLHGEFGIVSTIDKEKKIIPTCSIQYSKGVITATFEDKNIDQGPEIYKSTNIANTKQFETFIRSYFANRIDHLR